MSWTEDVPSIEEVKRFEGAKPVKDNNKDELNLTRTERVLLDKHRAIINMEKTRLMQRVCMWLHKNLGYYDRNEIHIGKSYEERVIEDLQNAIWKNKEE